MFYNLCTSIINQLQTQVEQLTEENKKLEGGLQTATRESLSDRKHDETEKFKTKLNASADRTEKAGELFEARLQDELGKVKEENREKERQQINPVAVS